jgi:hypothetical protein
MGEKFVCALQNPYTQGTHGVSMIGIVAEINDFDL